MARKKTDSKAEPKAKEKEQSAQVSERQEGVDPGNAAAVALGLSLGALWHYLG